MAKPRTPVRESFLSRDGERVIVRSIAEPTEWFGRDDFERAYGDELADVLDRHFGVEWLRQQRDCAHYVARLMSRPRSWAPFEAQLADFAHALLHVERAGGADLIARLRIHDEFAGAAYEARVARLTAEAGMELEFVEQRHEKAPDMQVCGASPFFIEVKHVQNADRNRLKDYLTSLVGVLPTHELFGYRITMDWSGPAVSAIDLGKNDWYADAREIAGHVGPQITAKVRRRGPGSYSFWVDDIVRVDVGPEAPEHRVPNAFGIDTVIQSDVNEERLGRSTLRKAAKQLPERSFGLVALCAESGVVDVRNATTTIEEAFEEDGDEMTHVVGALLLVTNANLDRIAEWTVPVANPHARAHMDDLSFPLLARAAEHPRWAARRPRG